ncbi:MAG: Ig-like domain-containing protein, partial [Eubacterium sp.]|nr:Ig-like domain-containing protein [Eubacterium sp.]
IYVNVYKVEATGETTVGNASCVIRVVFGIDTSNDNDFDNVYESDEDKSLIMYTNSPQKQLKLNFGDVADTTWRSLNSEVASVSSAGKVTAIGAGYTQIEAEYTQPGTTETFTAYLGVYVIPMVSATNGSGYSTGPTIPVDDGGYIYTDTVFTNNIDPIRNKIYWEIKVESTGGNQVIIANSAGMDSELISLSPTNSHSNQMQVTGVAGTYYVYFYAYNRSHASEITEVKYTPTVATITIKSAIKHKDIVLGIGDYLDLAKSFNMTLSDFKSYFTPSFTDTVGPENYATLDKNKMTVKGVREGKVKIKLEINKSPIDMEPKVKALLGLNEDDPFPNDNKPPFILTITIVDGITLGEEAVVISVKQTYQLVATLHGTYSGDIKWNSSDNSYVTVDDTGMITGVKVTTTDVTVTASVQIAGGITRTASCVVKVENAVTDFTLSPPGDKYMDVGEVLTLEAKIKETVSVAPLRWISSKEEVFTVTPAADKKTAVINAIAGGSGTLMVENTLNGKRVQIDITVRIPITSLEFSEEDYKFPFYQNGHNMKEELKIEPSDATTTKLKWTVDNTSVATIDDAGYLKFKAPGTVLVTVRPEHNPNALLPQVVVKIIGGPEEIIFENLKDDHLDIEAGETKTVNLKFVPATAETKLIWKTDKAGIVLADYNDEKRTVDIIGRAPGNVTVTCRTEDNVYYSFTVTVKQASSGIEFPETAITLYRGDPVKGIYQLKPILKPETSTDTVTYKMRDDKIASVDENGLVTGLAAGTTYVMATTSSGKTNVVDVTVIDMVTALESDFRSAVVYIGETLTISPTVVPDTAANKNIKWYWEPHEPGGTAEVELTEKGSSVDVVGKSKGLVMLTGESVDNPAAKVTYILNVKYRNPQYNTTVILTPKTKYVNVGKKFKVTRTVKNAYKGNKKLKWKSSNKKVATVNSKGVVKAKKVGKATITATAQDGSKAKGKMKLIVRRQVTKLKMNRTSANILIGKSIRLRVSVTPSNATVKGVKWKSGDTAIATVDGGKVIGVGVGMVKITATSKDTTKKKCYCWVTVSEPVAVTNFTIPDANITVAKGNSVQSGIVPNPTNATDSIKFWSDNPSVASVTSRGKIKAKKVGKATIYARAANGVEGHVDVTVVDLNRKAVTLRQYDTEQLSVNMISTGVTWYSASPNIASVDANGLVKAKMPGVTIIYANVDGVKLGCKVTVKRIT